MHPSMDRHGHPRPRRYHYYDDEAYYEDWYVNSFYDGCTHEYAYHKTRLHKTSQRQRVDYHCYDDGSNLPSYSSHYHHLYQASGDLYCPCLLEDEYVPQKLHKEEYTRPIGWFYERFISRAERVVTARTVRLWSGWGRARLLGPRGRWSGGRNLWDGNEKIEVAGDCEASVMSWMSEPGLLSVRF